LNKLLLKALSLLKKKRLRKSPQRKKRKKRQLNNFRIQKEPTH